MQCHLWEANRRKDQTQTKSKNPAFLKSKRSNKGTGVEECMKIEVCTHLNSNYFFNFNFNLFYLFIFGCVGSSWLHAGFL